MYNRILVTGGTGFVGKNLIPVLESKYSKIDHPSKTFLNLLDFKKTQTYLEYSRPDCIIHLAATCGGIGANKVAQGTFMRNNLTMGVNLINNAIDIGCVKKFIMISTVCAYPKYTQVPFKEEDLWNGYPEETNAPYGIAKKTLVELLQAYYKEFGFNSVSLIPTNMMGPHDHFNLTTSHVIPAIILKVYDAIIKGEDRITIWGTGSASREFLYVGDFCKAVELALENEPGPEPMNVPGGEEVTILNLTKLICHLMNYNGEIVIDPSLPDGQPRRCVSGDRIFDRLGFKPTTNLITGLLYTIEWFLSEIQS